MTERQDDLRNATLPLHAETVTVARRVVPTETVRVATITHRREQVIDAPVSEERVEIERIPIGRPIAAPPPVREEGDTTIIPVVEEIVVVERRLILKEEIRIRKVRSTTRHRETVLLREQEAVVTRTPAPPDS